MILIHPHHSIWLESILPKLSSEEGLDHFKTDVRNNPKTITGKTRFHFKRFPRTVSGKLYFEPVFQIELQKAGWYHLHYKNFRLELGKDQLKNMADVMKKAE